MTPIEVTIAIRNFLLDVLRDFRVENESEQERPVKLYMFHLPEQALAAMNPHAEDGFTPIVSEHPDTALEGVYPSVIVRPLAYQAQDFEEPTSNLTVSLTVGAFSRDPLNVNGPWAVQNIMERIRQALIKKRILADRCEIVPPLSWELYNEELRPLWFGEMITQWRILNPRRMDPEDWQGDFVYSKEEGENG